MLDTEGRFGPWRLRAASHYLLGLPVKEENVWCSYGGESGGESGGGGGGGGGEGKWRPRTDL